MCQLHEVEVHPTIPSYTPHRDPSLLSTVSTAKYHPLPGALQRVVVKLGECQSAFSFWEMFAGTKCHAYRKRTVWMMTVLVRAKGACSFLGTTTTP
jgi:hypothetical protein